MLLILLLICGANCFEIAYEAKLRNELVNRYDYPVRPVQNDTEQLVIFIGFKLVRVIELNLVEQLLTLDLEINQEWTDYKLSWDPTHYGGLSQISIPSNIPWTPDLQLYTSRGAFTLNGNFVSVTSEGLIKWRTRSITYTYCEINVRAYPFDIQSCRVEFGSWTYSFDQVRLSIIRDNDDKNQSLQVGMDLANYVHSPEWDLMELPVNCNEFTFACCPEYYGLIVFNVSLRRHWKFYFLYVVLPLVGLSYLSLLVFYLPADSGEKMTLCMSLLASQIMFLVPMIDNIPETSVAVPLLGKIILFNLTLLFCSIASTAFVLNIHYRKPSTHKMPEWVKNLRSRPGFLTKVLFFDTWETISPGIPQKPEVFTFKQQDIGDFYKTKLPLKIQRSFGHIQFVQDYIKLQKTIELECDVWKFLAALIDRVFLVVFNLAFLVAMGLFLREATTLFDSRVVLDPKLISEVD